MTLHEAKSIAINLTRFLRLSNIWVTLLCDCLVFYVASISCIVLRWKLVCVNYVLSASVWSSKNAWPPVGHIADRSNCYLCLRCDPPVGHTCVWPPVGHIAVWIKKKAKPSANHVKATLSYVILVLRRNTCPSSCRKHHAND